MSDEKKVGFWQRVFGRNPGATPAPGCCCASAMEQAIEDAKRLAAEEKDGTKPDSCCPDERGSGDCCCS